jgi:hypothetical protein
MKAFVLPWCYATYVRRFGATYPVPRSYHFYLLYTTFLFLRNYSRVLHLRHWDLILQVAIRLEALKLGTLVYFVAVGPSNVRVASVNFYGPGCSMYKSSAPFYVGILVDELEQFAKYLRYFPAACPRRTVRHPVTRTSCLRIYGNKKQ